MPTPFSPAMDPQIERAGIWSDFHHELISSIRAQLNTRLPRGYATIVEQQVRLLPAGEAEGYGRPVRHRQPDLGVVRDGGGESSASPASVASLEPTVAILDEALVEVKQTFLQVVSVPDRDLVTTVEVLSPTNKQGEGREIYLMKRGESWAAEANLLELDLLLRGRRLDPQTAMPPPGGGYCAVLSRAPTFPNVQIYRWPAADPLPTVPVPLLPGDGDVALDLRAAVDEVYDRGRYESLLNYDAPA